MGMELGFGVLIGLVLFLVLDVALDCIANWLIWH